LHRGVVARLNEPLRVLAEWWENRGIGEESRETMASDEVTTKQVGATPVLFDLPEYDWAFAKFVKHAVDELMTRKSPLLSRIKAVRSSTIPTSRNTMPSGEVVENAPIAMQLPFSMEFADAIVGRLEPLVVSIDQAAEQGVTTVTARLLDFSGRLSEAAGTATDAGGETFSHKLIVKSLQNMDLDFDGDGQLDMSSMILHSAGQVIEFDELIRSLPPRTEEETLAWNELVDRKRKEFNDRRHRRQLS
jgi:hypothetical protein